MRIIRFDNKGWRARFDDGFDEQNLSRIADAFGYIWADAHPKGTVLVGYDTRYNGRGLAGVVAGVLAGYGLKAVVAERPCPTPALGWCVSQDVSAVGAIMLTASSASSEYGGITVRAANGGPVSDEFYDAAMRIISSAPVTRRGNYSYADFVSPYVSHLCALVDGRLIADASLKVVVDPMFGAGRSILAQALKTLGCRVNEVHNEPSPDFGGLHPVPAEPWVDTCEQAVIAYESDLGIVLDGDGDRFGVVSEKGRFVAPHYTVPLIMEHLVRDRGEDGRIVATFSSSAYVRRQANRLDCEFTAVPMGFSRIYREFADEDVLLGADEYGGIAIPAHLPERDGLLSALLFVELVAKRRATVSALVQGLCEQLGTMHYIRRNIHLDVASIQAFRNILPGLNLKSVCGMTPVSVSHSDGLVLRFPDYSWVQLRPSRTEPVVRACAEAPDIRMAERLAEEACAGALERLPS